MAEQTGVPYPSDEAGPVDEWSERIYNALADWPLAQQNEWTRWDPGYVLLTIRQVDGAEVDPIQVYSADDELTVSFGFWETHTPAPHELWNAEPEVIAPHAKELVEKWLRGDVRTAVLTDQNGKWCGSVIVEPGELLPQLRKATEWVGYLNPVRIEVRTPYKEQWESYEVQDHWRQPSN
jgi:hypothetical protein